MKLQNGRSAMGQLQQGTRNSSAAARSRRVVQKTRVATARTAATAMTSTRVERLGGTMGAGDSHAAGLGRKPVTIAESSTGTARGQCRRRGHPPRRGMYGPRILVRGLCG